MIPLPPGWAVRRCEDSLLLTPPDGPGVGAIRYVERLRPLRRAVDLVRDAPAPAGFVEGRLGTPERLVTAEGEHAAFVVSEGTIGGVAAERPFGFVFGDDFYARIAGLAVGPGSFARVRAAVVELTLADTHDLGVRRRRCVYAPPRDWRGRAGLFDATWYPRDYPAERAAITVCPAVPFKPGLAPALLDAVLAGRPLAEIQLGAEQVVQGRAGLTGGSTPPRASRRRAPGSPRSSPASSRCPRSASARARARRSWATGATEVRVDLDGARWPVGVRLETEPLVSQPYDREAWRRRVVEAGLGGAPARSTATTTRCGSPLELVESEAAIVALYTFVDHVGVAVARAPDAAALAAHRDEIVALLRDARPDWRGPEIVCLVELWEA
jgi:hypothetical protein